MVVWGPGIRGESSRRLHVPPVTLAGDGETPLCGRLDCSSLKMKSQNEFSGLTEEIRKNAHGERTPKPCSSPRTYGYKGNPRSPCYGFHKDRFFFLKIPDFLPLCSYALPRGERSNWRVSLSELSMLSLSSFLFELCLLIENASLSQTQYSPGFNNILIIQNSMSKIH